MRTALAIASCLVVLAGCAGGDEDAAPATTGKTRETASVPPTTTGETTTAPQPPRLRLETVASGLESPVHVAAAPGFPGRLYVVEQEGRIRVVEDGRVADPPFLDIRDEVGCCGEQGLLSVAFHPDFAENHRFYVDFTNEDGDTRVVEYRARPGGASADLGSARELLAVDQPYTNHNGGQLAFGPDGLLYVGMGDGGSGGDPENRAQDLGSRLGKLLRVDVDAPRPEWEIAAYGLRNPWRFSFDAATGDLFLGDVGQGSWEEVDHLPRRSGLTNFGWDVYEGRETYEDKEPNPAGELVMPVHVYPLDGEACSVVGGFVYRGRAMPAYAGRYFFADYCTGEISSFVLVDGKARSLRHHRLGSPEGLTSFGEDEAGELYVVASDGRLRRLIAS